MTHGLEALPSKGAGETYLSTPGGDRSDRSHPRNDLHSEIQTKTPVGAKPEKGTRFHPTAEFLSSTRNLLRDAATSMKIWFAVFEESAKPG